mmetsp:Transcript_10147/g.26330  ORF Transcript_10147/g.26330 Transcript_10147/m.26330 type:complete len:201 (-) Transcript_10147:441-1043(-)
MVFRARFRCLSALSPPWTVPRNSCTTCCSSSSMPSMRLRAIPPSLSACPTTPLSPSIAASRRRSGCPRARSPRIPRLPWRPSNPLQWSASGASAALESPRCSCARAASKCRTAHDRTARSETGRPSTSTNASVLLVARHTMKWDSCIAGRARCRRREWPTHRSSCRSPQSHATTNLPRASRGGARASPFSFSTQTRLRCR